MKQFLSGISLLVPSYEDGLQFYVGTLGFYIIEDRDMGDGKRWVLVAPPGSSECRLLLAKAATPEQERRVGSQTGGRVFLFLQTDDFARDHIAMTKAGVDFLEAPRHEPYGSVAVFQDPFGNKWDLIEPNG